MPGGSIGASTTRDWQTLWHAALDQYGAELGDRPSLSRADLGDLRPPRPSRPRRFRFDLTQPGQQHGGAIPELRHQP